MEQWKNSVLGSLAGMEKAKPDPDLFLRIKDKIKDQKQKTIKEPKIAWMSVAAAILIVVCSNVVIIQNYFESQDATENQTNFTVDISRDYNIYQ